MKLEKFLELFWKELLYLTFKIMIKPCFHLYLTSLSIHLDNDDANDDENDIVIFSRTDKHRTYEIPQKKKNNLYTKIRSKLKITVSHQLSAVILLLLFQLQ